MSDGIKLSTLDIDDLKLGSLQVDKLYLGSSLIWSHNVGPAPSTLITMNLGNAAPAIGTNNLYRVLSKEGTVAEVLAMYDVVADQAFNPWGSGETYENSALDTYLNTTWYSTLSATAKAAIVDKIFTQDEWSVATTVSVTPKYSGKYGTNTYEVGLNNAAIGNEITRHIYALSLQDVVDYVTNYGDETVGEPKLQSYNIWKLFWNTTSSPGTYAPYLRSKSNSESYGVCVVPSAEGRIAAVAYSQPTAKTYRPAFKIDLSKIEYQEVEE